MAPSGGVILTISIKSLHVVHSTFDNNAAVNAGGIMYSSQSGSLTVATSIFSGNKAILGGIMHVFDSQMMIANCYLEKTMTSYIGSMYVFLAFLETQPSQITMDLFIALTATSLLVVTPDLKMVGSQLSTISLKREVQLPAYCPI